MSRYMLDTDTSSSIMKWERRESCARMIRQETRGS